jgi:hypothetical protein
VLLAPEEGGYLKNVMKGKKNVTRFILALFSSSMSLSEYKEQVLCIDL